MKDRILFVKPETWHLIKRMAIRSVFLMILFSTGLLVLDTLINSGFGDKYALVRRFPDMIPMMNAAAILTFINMSIFWIRIFTAPKHVVQEAKSVAMTTPSGAAVVVVTDMLGWAVQVAAFLYLSH